MNIIYLLAALGHVFCGITDCLFAYTPNGRFDMRDAKDSKKMSEVFDGMPLERLEIASTFGALALTVSLFGFLELSKWMNDFSRIASVIMYISGIAFIVPIVAHHICCGVVEWFYVKLGRTEEALSQVLYFFKKTIITAYVGYLALAVFSITLAVVILTGNTDLPRWAAVFTTFPLYLIISPTKLPAKGNIANAAMFIFFYFI